MLATNSFQDMSDWVNCLRVVAFGSSPRVGSQCAAGVAQHATSKQTNDGARLKQVRDVLLTQSQQQAPAHANKARQRQPSFMAAPSSCSKPEPPANSPFIPSPAAQVQLQANAKRASADKSVALAQASLASAPPVTKLSKNEAEENLLYCSIENNPSERNYRVKVIETELSLRCQLKCHQLTEASMVSQQYEALGAAHQQQHVTFYQLIVGCQQLTLLNDYATSPTCGQQQGLWSWPYQCIRRYGFDKDHCFMFEAGRKCGSGPGQFIVQTPNAYSIYKDVVQFVNELRTQTDKELEAASGAALSSSEQNLPATAQHKQQQQATQITVAWKPTSTPTSALVATVGAPDKAGTSHQAGDNCKLSENQNDDATSNSATNTNDQCDDLAASSSAHSNSSDESGYSGVASTNNSFNCSSISTSSDTELPANSNSTRCNSNTRTKHNSATELLGQHHDAFRVNLIRDVFSEISQLQQARFAVVTSDTASQVGSDDATSITSPTQATNNDDSMSSTSSTSATSTAYATDVATSKQVPTAQALDDLASQDASSDQLHLQLKPIPECNEQNATNCAPPPHQAQQSGHKQSTARHRRHHWPPLPPRPTRQQQQDNRRQLVGNSGEAGRQRLATSELIAMCERRELQPQTHTNAAAASRVPRSRHYFINNAQYTKINKSTAAHIEQLANF